MYLNFINLGNSKSKMTYSWQFWIIIFSYFHQFLHICSSSSFSSSFTINLFEEWSQEHEKSYSSNEEKQFRTKILEDNYNYITQHNSETNLSYTLSLNPFADLTHHEFKAKYLLGQPHPSISPPVLDSTATTAGPIRVGICASDRAFQFYSKGIFTGPCCDTLDHSVLIVGDDSRNGIEYWKVKNSWGEKWGMNGYMDLEVKRNGNSCGINTEEIITNSKSDCYPWYCPGHQTCCCYKRVLLHCMEPACCDTAHPVCCKVNRNCCPEHSPSCSSEKPHVCYGPSGNATLAMQSTGGHSSAMLGN